MGNDTVGYKKPPAETRFRPGVSGNPGGRSKRGPSFRETLLAQLAAPSSDGGPRDRTNLQALVKTLVEAAVSGDTRAQVLVLGALARFGEPGEQEAAAVSPEDDDILEAYVASETEPLAIEGTPEPSETSASTAGEHREVTPSDGEPRE
jgi:hypothetical protein